VEVNARGNKSSSEKVLPTEDVNNEMRNIERHVKDKKVVKV